jgi:hypothetical protein
VVCLHEEWRGNEGITNNLCHVIAAAPAIAQTDTFLIDLFIHPLSSNPAPFFP